MKEMHDVLVISYIDKNDNQKKYAKLELDIYYPKAEINPSHDMNNIDPNKIILKVNGVNIDIDKSNYHYFTRIDALENGN